MCIRDSKNVTLNAYPISLKISEFSAQCKTVLGLITVDISPLIKPDLVKSAVETIDLIISFPFFQTFCLHILAQIDAGNYE